MAKIDKVIEAHKKLIEARRTNEAVFKSYMTCGSPSDALSGAYDEAVEHCRKQYLKAVRSLSR